MSITTEQLRNAYQQSGNVYSGAEKIGSIGQIYLDDRTSEPTWVTVKTGLFGASESFVPLFHARIEGNDIVVDYDEETIKNAPRIDADDDLTPREEVELFRYYSRSAVRDTSDDRFDTDRDQLARVDDSRDRDARDWNDTADPDTRRAAESHVSEERAVDTPPRGRLRRYIVTKFSDEPIENDPPRR
jgi:PRC-barrel domain